MRQTLAAAVRYGYLATNPAVLAGANPAPAPRAVRVYHPDELAALEQELGPQFGPLVGFAAETGLRPSEWASLDRRHVDRARRVLTVYGTKTRGSRREVPLTLRAIAALDRSPTRLDSPLVFPADRGGVLNLDNWRRRMWAPAVESAGIARPARIYDLRSTFASRALAAGVAPFELSRVMVTSVRMIELHYGTLIAGAGASIAARLDALADVWATIGPRARARVGAQNERDPAYLGGSRGAGATGLEPATRVRRLGARGFQSVLAIRLPCRLPASASCCRSRHSDRGVDDDAATRLSAGQRTGLGA